MSKIPGNEIIKEILNGNEKTLKTIYKKVYRHLKNYGTMMHCSNHNVEEAVQDAFEVFYRKILNKKLDLNCSVDTYIIAIAKNLLHKNEQEMGTFNKDSLSKIELTDEDPLNQQIEEQKHELFISEFNKLNDECKRIITLTLEGYSGTQIKNMMNYSTEEFVRIKRFRCKQYLTEKIKENPEYEKLRNPNPEDFELPIWRNEP